MAFNKPRSGDRLQILYGGSTVPKTWNTAAAWNVNTSAWNTNALGGALPQVGDLVIPDITTSGLNDGVQQAQASEKPYGMVESINSGNGTLSVLLFDKIVALVMEGVTNTAPPAIGTSVLAQGAKGTQKINGTLRDQVKTTAAAIGGGRVVAILTAQGATTGGLIVVEWPRVAGP
jgi:hypothetical protein